MLDLSAQDTPPFDLWGKALRPAMLDIGSRQWDLREAIERIPRKPDRHGRAGVHPSDAGRGCMRALVYGLLDAPRTQRRLSEQDAQCFNHGDAIHLQWQAYCIHAGDMGLLDDVRAEVPVEDPALGIVGTADLVYAKDGHAYVVDFKSAGPTTFYGTKDLSKASSPIASAKGEHARQLTMYMACLGAWRGQVVYIDKALDGRAVTDVPWNDKAWKDVRRDLETARDMIAVQALPRGISDPWKCGQCPFKEVCDVDMTPRAILEARA